MTQAVRAVLFDLDGTLLDTAPDMAAALNALRQEEGLPELPFLKLRPLVSHGAAALVRQGFPQAEGQRFEALRERFLGLYARAVCVHTRPYEGVPEALTHLDLRGVPWGIVTNKSTALTGPLLEMLGLRDRAGTLVCRDTLPERKPHPRPLLHAAERLGVEPAATIYVGDAEGDVQAARAAGMRAFVALYGYIPVDERPREWPATGWLETSQGLKRWLDSLLQPT